MASLESISMYELENEIDNDDIALTPQTNTPKTMTPSPIPNSVHDTYDNIEENDDDFEPIETFKKIPIPIKSNSNSSSAFSYQLTNTNQKFDNCLL